mmetsp:Transcript_474/g.600  ORF Transcript_474/g.600 Transcript_474/m.600 type:complete len:93 (+) Transcript_474:267-545(+)
MNQNLRFVHIFCASDFQTKRQNIGNINTTHLFLLRQPWFKLKERKEKSNHDIKLAAFKTCKRCSLKENNQHLKGARKSEDVVHRYRIIHMIV